MQLDLIEETQESDLIQMYVRFHKHLNLISCYTRYGLLVYFILYWTYTYSIFLDIKKNVFGILV